MFELSLQVVECDGQLVGYLRPGLGALEAGVLLPYAVELRCGILTNLCLNISDVVLVEV